MCGIFSLATLACGCASSAASCCFNACPGCKNSTSARIMYSIILLCTLITSCVMLSPGLQQNLKSLPFCKDDNVKSNFDSSEQTLGLTNAIQKIDCGVVVGYLAVYRLNFIVTLFFLSFAMLMINVKSTNDARAGIQNGFWGIKFLIIIGGTIGAFFIPHGAFKDVWMWFGTIGGSLFILIQLLVLIDFAHSWAENWVKKYEEEGKGWMIALTLVMVSSYIAAFVGLVLLYIFYTGSFVGQCKTNEFVITLNMILCVILSIVSLMPQVQEKMPRSGLLQSSILTLYMTYLVWSALSNNPDNNCNPNLSEHEALSENFKAPSPKMHTTNIIGLVVWFFCLMYSSIANATGLQTPKISDSAEDAEAGGQEEEEEVSYNWSLGHFMSALATLYAMMTLTNWFDPSSDVNSFIANTSSMWVKIISSWVCAGIYGWTMVAPIVLEDRDFGYV